MWCHVTWNKDTNISIMVSIYQTTCYNIPKDHKPNIHCREKFRTFFLKVKSIRCTIFSRNRTDNKTSTSNWIFFQYITLGSKAFYYFYWWLRTRIVRNFSVTLFFADVVPEARTCSLRSSGFTRHSPTLAPLCSTTCFTSSASLASCTCKSRYNHQ